jgi:hypothetical protein
MTKGHGSRVIDTIWRELRYALRSLRKSWGFTVLAVASLGIGLGANTALFSLVDALLLRTLPVAEPERLVLVQRIGANGKAVPLDDASLQVIRELTPIYRDAALSTVLPSAGVTIDTQPEPAWQVFTTSATFFQTLGIAAQAGRLHDSEPIAVISDRFWSARFSRNPDAIGRPLVVDGATYPIAGVAAPGFRGVSLDSAGDIWLVQPQFRGMATSAIARLTPEVTIDLGHRCHRRSTRQRELFTARQRCRTNPDVDRPGRSGHLDASRAVPRATARAHGAGRPGPVDDLCQRCQPARRPEHESGTRAQRSNGAGCRPLATDAAAAD